MDNLSPALPDIAKKGIKVAVNAGACDTELLARRVQEEVDRQELGLKVAFVEGDEVTGIVKQMIKQGEKFPSLMTGKDLEDWGYDPIFAQSVISRTIHLAFISANDGTDVISEEPVSHKLFRPALTLSYVDALRMLHRLSEVPLPTFVLCGYMTD